MTNDVLTIILAALTAFFTLITGAFAVVATLAIFYFRKLADDRRREIIKLTELQTKFEKKIKEGEEKLRHISTEKKSTAQLNREYKEGLDSLRREYINLRNQFYHIPGSPGSGEGFVYDPLYTRTPTVADLQAQIQALLDQITTLQAQLMQDDTKDKKTGKG